MKPDEFDLTQASRICSVANTPLFLVRKLQADPVVHEISDTCQEEEILDALRASVMKEPINVIEVVRPYAFLVALWFKPDIGGLEEAARIPAPSHNWYAYIAAALKTTFSPVQSQIIQMPRKLSALSATNTSSAPTNQIIQKPGRLFAPFITETSPAKNQIIIVP